MTSGHDVAVTFTGGRYPHRPTCSCGWATWGYLTNAAAQNVADDHKGKRMTETRLIRDMPIERRDDLIAQVWAFLTDRGYTITAPGLVSLETRLADMTREARLSREATEKAVRRENRLRDRIAYLHDVYAVSPNEPRCCSDCAANDISAELRLALRETGDVDA